MTLDEALSELRTKNESVPRPARLPTPNEVEETERILGIRFKPDFRRYLLEASDIVFGVLELVTITNRAAHTDLVRICKTAWDKVGVPQELLPICENNGDYFCMTENGEVVFWSHNGWAEEKWPNFATWIEKVWIEESSN